MPDSTSQVSEKHAPMRTVAVRSVIMSSTRCPKLATPCCFSRAASREATSNAFRMSRNAQTVRLPWCNRRFSSKAWAWTSDPHRKASLNYPAVGERPVSCNSKYSARHDMSVYECYGPVFVTITGRTRNHFFYVDAIIQPYLQIQKSKEPPATRECQSTKLCTEAMLRCGFQLR